MYAYRHGRLAYILRKTGYYGLQNMDANVTIQIQNKRKEEFSTRILEDSKDRFSSRKKCTTSNTISLGLHDKNLNRAIEIGIAFMYIFEANWSEGFMGGFLSINQIPEVSILMISLGTRTGSIRNSYV